MQSVAEQARFGSTWFIALLIMPLPDPLSLAFLVDPPFLLNENGKSSGPPCPPHSQMVPWFCFFPSMSPQFLCEVLLAASRTACLFHVHVYEVDVSGIHLCMCWHAGWRVQTCWRATQRRIVLASTVTVIMENKFWFLFSVWPLIFWSLVGILEFHPSARCGGVWMICSKSDCGGRFADELWMQWYMETTDHQTVTKTNHLFSYGHHYAHPDYRLPTGSWLRGLCSVSELRQKGHFTTASPPAQGGFPTCALKARTFWPLLLPQGTQLVTSAHRRVAVAHGLSRTIILLTQRWIYGTPTLLRIFILLWPSNPSEGCTDLPGKPVETHEDTLAGNALFALAEPCGGDGGGVAKMHGASCMHRVVWADQRYQELCLAGKDTLYTEPQWTLPPKSWTTKMNTEMGNSWGKDASFPWEGHWWLLKEILIQNWHYQGLVLGTGLHKSTDQKQFQPQQLKSVTENTIGT